MPIKQLSSLGGEFTLDAPASASNRTITLPDATTTLVGTDATQTLTNKTLTAPVIDGGASATGSFTGTLTGCTTSPTGTIEYVRVGKLVTLYIPSITGTSNTTAATVTGAPSAIFPSASRVVVTRIADNSVALAGMATIGTDGVITLALITGGGFTASGVKGTQNCSVTYIV